MNRTPQIPRLIPLVFLGGLFLVAAIAWLGLGNGHSSIAAENRKAQFYEMPTVTSFLDADFQSNFEDAIADQMPGSGTMKNLVLTSTRFLEGLVTFWTDEDGYWLIGSNTYAFGDAEQLLYYPLGADYFEKSTTLERVAKSYNDLSGVEKYYYIVPSGECTDMRDPSMQEHLFADVVAAYDSFEVRYLRTDTIDEYRAAYYKTDHHWDYRGSYRGYSEIIEMILGADEPLLAPVDTYTWQGNTQGIMGRNIKFEAFHEDFSAYIFEVPAHDVLLGDEPATFDTLSSLYPYRVGGTAGEFDFELTPYTYYSLPYKHVDFFYNRPERPNLLIISDSMGAPIVELIASHFNHTHVINYRAIVFNGGDDPVFDVQRYIDENDIDIVLRLGNGTGCDNPLFALDGDHEGAH